MSDAEQQHQAGLELKAKGQIDAALTAFRRAAIADPNLFEAHREVAIICREKSRRDPMYKRATYDAFRAAARLNLDDEKVHDGYIVAAQESGRLDEAIIEYEALSHAHPANANLKRCYKNLTAITIAMIPKPREERLSSPRAKKIYYFFAVNFVVSGLFSLFTPVLAARSGLVAVTASDVVVGLAFVFAGAAAFILGRQA